MGGCPCTLGIAGGTLRVEGRGIAGGVGGVAGSLVFGGDPVGEGVSPAEGGGSKVVGGGVSPVGEGGRPVGGGVSSAEGGGSVEGVPATGGEVSLEGVSSFGGAGAPSEGGGDGGSIVGGGVSVTEGVGGVRLLVGCEGISCSVAFCCESVGELVGIEGVEDIPPASGVDVPPVVGRANSFCATGVALTERTAAPSSARTGCVIPKPTVANPSRALWIVSSFTPSRAAAWVTCSSTCSSTLGKARSIASCIGRLTGVYRPFHQVSTETTNTAAAATPAPADAYPRLTRP